MSGTPEGRTDAPVVGVVPAAGRARRLGWLPCSKELLPLLRPAPPSAEEQGPPGGAAGEIEPDPVCYSVLRALARAGVQRAYVPIRSGKWDVPDLLHRGEDVDLALSDVVLGLFPASSGYRTECVTLGEDGAVREIGPRAASGDDRLTWTLAVWGPAFGEYLHERVETWDRVATEAAGAGGNAPEELVLGDVFRTALAGGLRIEGLQVSDKPFVDVGDPDRLMMALREAYGQPRG